MMLSDDELGTLEKRAQNALSGYTHDVNITCYVYGQDVLMLVQEVRRLKEECEQTQNKLRLLGLVTDRKGV